MLENFKNHLLTYLDQTSVDCLISSITNKRLTGLLLNTKKLSFSTLSNYFPQLKEHFLIPNSYVYDPNIYSPGKTFLFDAGCYYIQDLSAMLVAALLDVDEDDFVVDLCASPGGKTVQTSIKMNNKGLIIANDINGLRAKVLSSNVERMGLANVIVTNEDANALLKKLKIRPTKIILDAPCSGSGMFRKLDKMIEDWSYEKVKKYAVIQKELLENAFNKLTDGGTLIYSTCSFSYEENEEVILALLNKYDNVELVNLSGDKHFYSHPSLKEAIHLFPHLYEGDGHFICKLKKTGSLPKKEAFQKSDVFGKFTLDLLIKKLGETYYGLTTDFDTTNLKVLRLGVALGTINKSVINYDHHLAHYLSSQNSLALTKIQKDAYIKGLTIEYKDIENGFHIVSYDGINLGFVKAVNGILKNHYPKGLRH